MSIPNRKTKDEKGNNLHDTEKPGELMKILIENSSLEGETVFDPFAGIARIASECRKLKRNFIGYELDENYYNIAKERLKIEDKTRIHELKRRLKK